MPDEEARPLLLHADRGMAEPKLPCLGLVMLLWLAGDTGLVTSGSCGGTTCSFPEPRPEIRRQHATANARMSGATLLDFGANSWLGRT